ncbi:MAG TPA: hypothetical protein VGB45_03350 [Abditibacterium sp.]|jgi:hypothetical protein
MFKFKKHLTAAILGLGLLSLNTGAQAGIINGDFSIPPTDEDPIPGWQVTGASGVAYDEDISEGTAVAFDEGVSQTELEKFFNLEEGDLDNPFAPNPFLSFYTTEGSGFYQTFTGDAGDTVSFDSAFVSLTDEESEIFENDFGFFVFDGQVQSLGDTFEQLAGLPTEFTTTSFVLTSSGTHTLGFGSANGYASFMGDPDFPNNQISVLLVDNVRVGPEVAPVPELSSGMLLMLSMGALMMACAFQKKRAAKAASQI